MLTEQQLRETLGRRGRILLPVMFCAVLATCAYLVAVDTLANRSILLVLPAFAVFLIPCVIAEKYVEQFSIVCPSCSADVTRSVKRLLATRCCPQCGARIIAGGRMSDVAVYERWCRLQFRSFLKHWLWAWPALACIALSWHWFDRASLQNCLQYLFVPSLTGTVAAGWSWLRTGDRRYLPQCIASAVLLIPGAIMFWE